MRISEICIERPVFATVLSLVIVLLGLVSFFKLTVREYPQTDSPVTSVQTTYRGASAEIMESQVTQVLEESLSGIEGIDYMTSSSQQGRSQININFNLDRDPDSAAADVRDRVSRIRDRLPLDVDEPVISKVESDSQPILFLSFKSSTMSPMDGDTTSSGAPTGGLYGAGRFSYTINDVTASGITAVSSSATSASINYDNSIQTSTVVDVLVSASALTGLDKAAIRSFVPSGSGFTTYYPQFTRLNSAQDSIIFTVILSNGATTGTVNIGKIIYSKQTTASARGDFEDTFGGSIPPNGQDINIPEINIQLRSEAVVAKSRKLKAVWTPELAQDLNAYHTIDAEAELTAILSEHIALEIDLEILEMLLVYAQSTEYWSATIGRVWNTQTSAFQNDTNTAAQAWTTMTWYQTLGNKMQKLSNRIHKLTMRGGANFAVVSPDVATVIETIPGFAAKTDGNQASFAMGVSQVGTFQNRFTIYKNPYLAGNVVLMGFRGTNFLETGAVYAPYVPLIMTPLVYDPQNFTPRRGVMTRYAKKMVRPEFYGKILIENLNQLV